MFLSFFLPSFGFVEKCEQLIHYCCLQRGIWPGFKGKAKASLDSLIPCSKTPLFWLVSPNAHRTAPHYTAPRSSIREGKQPAGPGRRREASSVSPSAFTAPKVRITWGFSAGRIVLSHPRVGYVEGEETVVFLRLRRRTRQQHIGRTLFCLARWPALFSHSTPHSPSPPLTPPALI